jgi:GNAT superfamily N-acetyltransferase
MQIRRALVAECERLTELAIRSKAHWGYDASFMAAARADLEVRPDRLPGFEVYLLEADDAIIGFYSLLPVSESVIEMDALFVDPEYIGKSYGRMLWMHAVERARALRFGRMILTADPFAEKFYVRCGMTRTGERESSVERGRKLPLLEFPISSAH